MIHSPTRPDAGTEDTRLDIASERRAPSYPCGRAARLILPLPNRFLVGRVPIPWDYPCACELRPRLSFELHARDHGLILQAMGLRQMRVGKDRTRDVVAVNGW